tara:strand:- start:457 stop:609 length:153 start_codon:yes stop_codon:yes gene_type:complete
MTKILKYIEIRIDQLKEEFAKNPSAENNLIFTKAINELYIVQEMLERHLK